MSCNCAARSIWEDQVFTCPVCASIAYRVLCALTDELASQLDLFEEEKSASVSAYTDLLDCEFEQKYPQVIEDGLPF